MKPLFICYPKCTTCQKAKKWLNDNNIAYTERNIKENHPTVEELDKWHKMSELPLRKFFNTSGILYRELNLKDKLDTMTDNEKINLLAKDGMLVKRPILVGVDSVFVGFNEKEWESFV
jgi:arsenate reductase